jgi:hypothetical protein
MRIIKHVRQQLQAGWFVGSIDFSDGEAECGNKESGYFPSEARLKALYPESIGIEAACQKALQFRWITWTLGD